MLSESLPLPLTVVWHVIDFCPRVPGEQTWVKGKTDLADGLQELSIEPHPLPSSVHTKYPLPEQKGEYVGALLKVHLFPLARVTQAHLFV